MDLPELPEPFDCMPSVRDDGTETTVSGFTDAQMRAHAEEAVKQEREAAAKACEDFGASYDNEWNRKLGVANDLKDACEECALAIRGRAAPSAEK